MPRDKISLLEPKVPNCASLVAGRVLNHFDIKDKNITTNLLFGFDLLGERTLCGAISGGIIAINKILIERGISDTELKYVLNQYLDNFKSNYEGALTCREIKEKYGNDKTCTDLIEDSTIDIKAIVAFIRDITNPTYLEENLRR